MPAAVTASSAVSALSRAPEPAASASQAEQPFQQVLAQEVSRQGTPAEAGQSAANDGKADGGAVSEESVAPVVPDAAAAQMAGALPWLPLLQPPVPPMTPAQGLSQVSTQAESPTGEQALPVAVSGLPAGTVTAQGGSQAGPAGQDTAALGAAALRTGQAGDDSVLSSAKTAAAPGKTLPQGLEAAASEPGFVSALNEHLAGEDVAKAQQLPSPASTLPVHEPLRAEGGKRWRGMWCTNRWAITAGAMWWRSGSV